jgi:hypothetical protein
VIQHLLRVKKLNLSSYACSAAASVRLHYFRADMSVVFFIRFVCCQQSAWLGILKRAKKVKVVCIQHSPAVLSRIYILPRNPRYLRWNLLRVRACRKRTARTDKHTRVVLFCLHLPLTGRYPALAVICDSTHGRQPPLCRTDDAETSMAFLVPTSPTAVHGQKCQKSVKFAVLYIYIRLSLQEREGKKWSA